MAIPTYRKSLTCHPLQQSSHLFDLPTLMEWFAEIANISHMEQLIAQTPEEINWYGKT